MKIRKILSLLINLVAVAASIAGFIVIYDKLHMIDFVKYFTIVTNVLIIIFGLVSMGYSIDSFLKKDNETSIPHIVYIFKLITAVCAMITFLTVVSYLQYTVYADPNIEKVYIINNIFHHYVSTLAFTCGFIFFELDKKYPFKLSFFGIIMLVVYMAYCVPFSNISACASWWGAAPYDFVVFHSDKLWTLVIIPIFLVGGVGLSMLLWLLNRIMYLIFIGEEVNKEAPVSEEEKEAEKKVEVTPEDENAVAKEITKGYKGPRIYHISKREDKKWQVKFANGTRAIKLFPTQAEAIVFAKKLAKSQEGSIRVHSVKGRIRKAN